MALTLKAEQRLAAVGAVDFFGQQEAALTSAAKRSLAFIKNSFPDKAEIRRDDVAQVLQPVMEVNKALKDFLAKKKLTQKYWISDFTDLIIDRVWIEINKP